MPTINRNRGGVVATMKYASRPPVTIDRTSHTLPQNTTTDATTAPRPVTKISTASAPASDVCEVLASEKQAGQGRRERAYPEDTCATENDAQRSFFAARTRRILLAGALTGPARIRRRRVSGRRSTDWEEWRFPGRGPRRTRA